MKVEALIPAAGLGLRLAGPVVKPLVNLGGRPLFIRTVQILARCPSIENLIVMADPLLIPVFAGHLRSFGIGRVKALIPGGATRSQSVANGLKVLDQDTGLVVVHDAARPLVTVALVESAIAECRKEEAVICAVPVKPTIKRVHPRNRYVEATLDRDLLWEAQTPQVFRREILERAHANAPDDRASDDAGLVERLGIKVKVIAGDYRNIKVTTPEDMIIGELFLPDAEK
jgi:2-C-methyl-D-erythritol 4-phosphate cytidylyltransferase